MKIEILYLYYDIISNFFPLLNGDRNRDAFLEFFLNQTDGSWYLQK
jgi:hypothetical protein